MKTMLFYVRMETQFLELMRLHALLTKLSDETKLIILFDNLPSSILDRMTSHCKLNHINYEICDVENHKATLDLQKIIMLCLCGLLGGSPAFQQNLYHEAHYFHSFFKSNHVTLIFVGEDGVGTTPSLFHAAKKLKIPCITVPYEYSSKKQAIESILSRADINAFKPITYIDKIIAMLFPKWLTSNDGEKYFRLPKHILIPMILFSSQPKLPWSVNGGPSSRLFCDSNIMNDFYKAEGISPYKIKQIGNLAHDNIYNILKSNEAYWAAYEMGTLIDGSYIKVLFSFPPDYTSSHKSLFETYESFIEYWINLSRENPFIVPLYQAHPAITDAQISLIESKGVILQKENIAQLIPKIDILVTSVSSVIRHAIALRKPVLNFDLYNFDYPDYRGVSGVQTVNTLESFTDEFQKTFTKQAQVIELKQQMKGVSNNWAMLDGKVGERILLEINGSASP